MVHLLQFSVSDPMIKSFFTILRRASWCGKAVVLFPTKNGLEILTSSDGLHFHVRISAEAFQSYIVHPSSSSGSGVPEVGIHDETNYISVSSKSIFCVAKSDPTSLMVSYNRETKPDEIVFIVDFGSQGVRKQFCLSLAPLPSVLLQLPPLRNHSHIVEAAASGRCWQDLVSRKAYCLLAIRPGELEVRWMEPSSAAAGAGAHESADDSRAGGARRAAAVGEDVISIPHRSFRYVRLLPRLEEGIPCRHEMNTVSFVYPPRKAVLARHLRQACLIMDKLGLGMEVTFAGSQIPLIIRSVELPAGGAASHPLPLPLPSSSSSPTSVSRQWIQVKICIAAKDFPDEDNAPVREQIIDVRATSTASVVSRIPSTNDHLHESSVPALGSAYDISVGNTTMTLPSEIVSTSTFAPSPSVPDANKPSVPPADPLYAAEPSTPKNHPLVPLKSTDTLVPPSYESSASCVPSSGTYPADAPESHKRPREWEARSFLNTMERRSTGGGSGLVDFSAFEKSPTSFLEDALGMTRGGGGEADDDEDEDDNEQKYAKLDGTGRIINGPEDLSIIRARTVLEVNDMVDNEMEDFLRDCAMTPPVMDHPWDIF